MANPYDEVLYAGHPFAQTHPNRLGTIARLFGMNPAPPRACSVLELGCGDGGNLLPMAYTLPGSRFLGIDASRRGLERGTALATALGIGNLELRHLDLLAADAGLGTFDYIVAHGVYSWTPPEVRERLLAICREHLAPQGVAYISYAAYPGAHVKTMVSDMLKHHARGFTEPERQIEQARALLSFLSNARPEDDAYSLLLRQEIDRLAARDGNTIFHDELSRYNQPFYFHEFAASAAAHSLQYLGEADFFEMQDCGQTAEATAMLRRLATNLIDREQYLDFLKCRRFRQTLLCHAGVPLDRHLQSARMREFSIAAPRAPQNDQAGSPVSSHPIAGALLAVTGEAWPAALSFPELLAEVRHRAGAFDEDELLLADLVLAHYACGLLDLHIDPPRFARQPGERPRASALARLQAGTRPYVTNLCHNVVRLEDEWSRTLLELLDGSRDRAALLADMRRAAADRASEIQPDDVARSVQGLADLALLEA